MARAVREIDGRARGQASVAVCRAWGRAVGPPTIGRKETETGTGLCRSVLCGREDQSRSEQIIHASMNRDCASHNFSL
jgi:hypothetical protein